MSQRHSDPPTSPTPGSCLLTEIQVWCPAMPGLRWGRKEVPMGRRWQGTEFPYLATQLGLLTPGVPLPEVLAGCSLGPTRGS